MLRSENKYQLSKSVFIKETNGAFTVLSSAGAHLTTNLEGALCLLSFHGSSHVAEVAEKLYGHGYSSSIYSINRARKNFITSGIITKVPKVTDYFDVNIVMENLKKFSSGACSLCELTISVTEKCSFSCRHCYRVMPTNSHKIDMDILTQSIIDARSLGARSLGITGGEPSLAIHKATQLSRVAYSNGFNRISFFLRDIIQCGRYLNELANAGVNELRVSIDNEFAVPDYLNFFAKCHSYGFRIILNIVLHSSIFEYQVSYLTSFCSLVDGIRVSPYIPFGELVPDRQRILQEMHNEISERFSNVEGFVCSFFRDASNNSPMICDAGLTFAHIETDGSVFGCPVLSNVYTVGNVNESSFLDIWAKSNWGELRQIIDINDRCGCCNSRSYCIGRCRAMAYAKFKTISLSCVEDTRSAFCEKDSNTKK